MLSEDTFITIQFIAYDTSLVVDWYGTVSKNPPNQNQVVPSLHLSSALCEAGSYITGDMTKCEACTDNSYSYEGAVSCITCPVGTLVNEDKTYCGELEHVRPG